MKQEKKKEQYEEAKAELVELKANDVIATSESALDPDGNYDDKAWT